MCGCPSRMAQDSTAHGNFLLSNSFAIATARKAQAVPMRTCVLFRRQARKAVYIRSPFSSNRPRAGSTQSADWRIRRTWRSSEATLILIVPDLLYHFTPCDVIEEIMIRRTSQVHAVYPNPSAKSTVTHITLPGRPPRRGIEWQDIHRLLHEVAKEEHDDQRTGASEGDEHEK